MSTHPTNIRLPEHLYSKACEAAMEAGNSEAVSRRNYHDAMSKADAVAWFRVPGKRKSRKLVAV